MSLFHIKTFSLTSFLRLGLLLMFSLALITFGRLSMLAFNLSLFTPMEASELFRIVIGGLRFDITAMIYLNLVFILLSLVFVFFSIPKWMKNLNLLIFYILPSALGIILNFSDAIYYRFTGKRTTADIFSYLGHAGDFGMLIPQFIRDFWYAFLCGVAGIILLIYLGKRINRLQFRSYKLRFPILTNILIVLIILIFSVIGLRGGLQLKPVGIAQAQLYATSEKMALVLNTPFSVIRTIGKTHLKEIVYFDNTDELYSYFKAYRQSAQTDFLGIETPIDRPNVVIILLESFSREHIGCLNPQPPGTNYEGYTPFLDSLIGHSLVFNGFANGKRSIEAIPSIISSVPSLMNNDFISSVYVNNQTNSMAAMLRKKDYQTMFFHGGTNGTMGFETYALSNGFEKYYGRTEYDNDADYDGCWGIFDEEFLQYAASVMSRTNQPFFSFIFTLSSHHPYTIPEKYQNRFSSGELPIHQAVAYADYSLRRFFETARHMPWFENTVFIITSDHTSEAWLEYYKTNAGIYAIPVIFYAPYSVNHLTSRQVVQHTDILPSVLHLLDHQENIISFGHSVFDTTLPRFNVTFRNGIFQLIKNNHLLHFDGEKSLALYDLETDSLCRHNVVDGKKEVAEKMENFLKSFIQQYNSRMIHNKLVE